MSRNSSFAFLFLTAAAFFGGAALWEGRVAAQDSEAAKITTVDGVKLHAFFYPSSKKNTATVILLHPLGEGKSIKLEGWKKLAESLQKNNFSVLMFDFRGHGDSTTVDPDEFWKYGPNRSFVKRSTKEGDSIDVKDFVKSAASYYPVLINDIAAVKAYLDRKHDAGLCNTSNTIVIGAENGGTLGAIWINSEWNRFKLNPPQNMFMPPQLDKRAEGNDIIGAVFLNIASTLGTRKVAVQSILNKACKVQGMPCVFLYGEKDAAAKKYNVFLADSLKVKGSKKHEGIVPAAAPNTSLSGVKLLTKGLKTDEFIAKYLEDNVLSEKNNDYETRDFQNNVYMWRNPFTGLTNMPAKTKNEKIFKYDTYEKFMQ